MNDKSHVSMERRVCLICAVEYDTGALLIDKRLRASMNRYTTTGWGLCPKHQQLFDKGFVALIECDPDKSGNPSDGHLVKPGQAYRTGKIAHLKREVFPRIFNTSIRPDMPYVFVEPGVIDKLQASVSPSAGAA